MGTNTQFRGKASFVQYANDAYSEYASIHPTANDMTITSLGNMILNTNESVGIGTTLTNAILQISGKQSTKDLLQAGNTNNPVFKVNRFGKTSATSLELGSVNGAKVSTSVDASGKLIFNAENGIQISRTTSSPDITDLQLANKICIGNQCLNASDIERLKASLPTITPELPLAPSPTMTSTISPIKTATNLSIPSMDSIPSITTA